MRVLVTGATGFVGRNLAWALADRGDEVHALVRPGSDTTGLLATGRPVTCHCHDGSTESMLQSLRTVAPQQVYHLASLFLASHQPHQVVSLIDSNVRFGAQLLEAMHESDCRYLVQAGTSWQHHRNREYDPVCLYAATKQAHEQIATFYAAARGFRIITLELFDTYGPGDPRPKLFASLQRASQTGEVLAMSEGRQILDLLYVRDVARAFCVAGERIRSRPPGEMRRYTLYGERFSLREVVELYNRISNRPVSVNWGARPYREREVMVPWTGGNPLPNWQPYVDLATGLAQVLSADADATGTSS